MITQMMTIQTNKTDKGRAILPLFLFKNLIKKHRF
jgi:hypothetical protein